MSETRTPVEVEARFTEEGAIEPLAFVLSGRRFVVAQQGRRWRDDENRYHFLVMTPFDEVWELVFDQSDLQWFIARRHSQVRAV